jgi:hypothetical protein
MVFDSREFYMENNFLSSNAQIYMVQVPRVTCIFCASKSVVQFTRVWTD